MSIIHAFDDQSEAILRPEYISSAGDNFPKTLIATFRPQIIKLLREQFETEEMGDMEAIVPVPVYCFTYKGRRLGMYLTMLGGPAAVGLMEEAAAMGGEKFLFFGSAGVLDRELAAGHLIIPTAAYRDEGASYHYMPPGDYVDVPTAGRLADIFTELGYPHVSGRIWTTDAIYRETRAHMEARRKEGCIAVDMECASLMAAGRFRNIPVYQFVYAEDSLDGEAWDGRTMLSDHLESAYEKYLEIVLETAIRL